MPNKRHMSFVLAGGAPLNLEDLAEQVQKGLPLTYEGTPIGRTIDGAVVDEGLKVTVEIDNPTAWPDLVDLQFKGRQADASMAIGAKVALTEVMAKVQA